MCLLIIVLRGRTGGSTFENNLDPIEKAQQRISSTFSSDEDEKDLFLENEVLIVEK